MTSISHRRGLSVLTRLAAVWLISFILLPFSAKAAAPLDSLGRLLTAYTKTLEGYSAEFKAHECDGLIAFCGDSLTRTFTAQTLYRHYAESPLMNDEAVAVHLYDVWFGGDALSAPTDGAPFKLCFDTTEQAEQARLFVSLNRRTLVGMTPPALTLSDEESNHIVIPDAPRAYILFFYSTECATCKLYTKQLESVIKHAPEPLDLYFIYTGGDREAWDKWRMERLRWNLSDASRPAGGESAADGQAAASEAAAASHPLEYFTTPPRIRMFHLWDPYHDSDFPASYGVVSTPRLFFVDENNRITGRRLDPESLQTLLRQRELSRNYVYGSEESLALFEGLLPEGGMDEPAVEEVLASVKQAGEERGDPDLYRHLTGDLLYYLSRRNSEEGIAACDRLIRDHILSDEIAWTGATDTLSVLQLARFLQDLHSKAAIGSSLPKVWAYVEDVTARQATQSKAGENGSSAKRVRLDRLKKQCRYARREAIFLFYDPECSDCKEQIARSHSIVANSPNPSCCSKSSAAANGQTAAPAIFLINVSENQASLSPAEFEALTDAFDLSSLPYLIRCDRKGVINRRYFKLD